MQMESQGDVKPEPDVRLSQAGQDSREKGPQGRYVKLEDRLGSGAYKDVWRAYDTNEGREVAWNVVKLNRIPPNERKRIKTEVKLLKDIEHKNVIKYYNSWVDREKEQIVFITEIMSHGSLKDYLRRNPMIRWNAVKRWCRQILKGLEFLHGKQIIHRDIKCDNIFVNGSTGDVRIGDLGLSTRISEERALQNGVVEPSRVVTASSMTCLGTPEFMAPELYEESYSEKVDIYAFGMTILEMVTGLMPYHECTSSAQIYRKVLNGELPPELDIVDKLNLRAGELIRSCLRCQETRPSAAELLEHEFLLRNDEEDFSEVRINLWHPAEAGEDTNEDDNDIDSSLHNMDEEGSRQGYGEVQSLAEEAGPRDAAMTSPHTPRAHAPIGVSGASTGPDSQLSPSKKTTISRNNSNEVSAAHPASRETTNISTAAQPEIPTATANSVLNTTSSAAAIAASSESPTKQTPPLGETSTTSDERTLVVPLLASPLHAIASDDTPPSMSGERKRSGSKVRLSSSRGGPSTTRYTLVDTSCPLVDSPRQEGDASSADTGASARTIPSNAASAPGPLSPHDISNSSHPVSSGANELSTQQALVEVVSITDQVAGSELIFHLTFPAMESNVSVMAQVEFIFEILSDDVQAIAEDLRNEIQTPTLTTNVTVSTIVDAVSPFVAAARELLSLSQGPARPLESIMAQHGSFAEAVIAETFANSANKNNPSLQFMKQRRFPAPTDTTLPPNVQADLNQEMYSTMLNQHTMQIQQQMQSMFNAGTYAYPGAMNFQANGIHPGYMVSNGYNQMPGSAHGIMPQPQTSSFAGPGGLMYHTDAMYTYPVAHGYQMRVPLATAVTIDTTFVTEASHLEDEYDDDLDVSFEADEEYQEMMAKHHDEVKRIEKEYNSKHTGVLLAIEKAEESYKKDIEKLVLRKEDLDKQLDIMIEKLRERMTEFSAKKQVLEDLCQQRRQPKADKAPSSSSGEPSVPQPADATVHLPVDNGEDFISLPVVCPPTEAAAVSTAPRLSGDDAPS